MKTTGTNLGKRSKAGDANGWDSAQAISILYHIALNGEFVANEMLFPLELMTPEDITAACQRLDAEDFICYWCGVKELNN